MPIIIEKLTHTYMPNTISRHIAVDSVDLTINEGEFFGIIGHTGSGKSTLIQHLNGLIQPTSGRVIVDGYDMSDKKQRVKGRALVGMVFQYPDYQLFDSTVLDDVAFGPKNMGLSVEEAKTRAEEAMRTVGLDPEQFAEKSPFELSGGEKRRAALAGIIAMRPKYLVLDEPMAGLDPSGRRGVLETISALRKELGCTVIMVSHSMEDVARSAERIAVMNDSKLYMTGTPDEIFSKTKELIELGLDAPQTARLAQLLRERGVPVPEDIYTNERFTEWFRGRMSNA
ncbi:MAG: energy-coupling factor transporter ATPase [Clostridia bacterium]|nr:energy-coupling factor transporter ATPase [Clostridia bacterium]